MEQRLRELVDHFLQIYGVREWIQPPLRIEFEAGPHTRPTPLRNERGVYLFFKGQEWLRIGQTGYSPRFTSQHYGTRRAGSSFAKDIWVHREEFGFNGEEAEISEWLFESFGRANIRIPPIRNDDAMSRLLEVFLHLNLSPRFEGRRKADGAQVGTSVTIRAAGQR